MTHQADDLAHTALTWAVWIAFLAQAWNSILGTPTIAFIGSYNFTVAEIAIASGGVALILGWRRYGVRLAVFTFAAGVFVLLTGLNLVRGLSENYATTLVAARTILPFSILLLLGTVRYPVAAFRQCLERSVTGVGIILALVVVARLAFGPQFLMVGGGALNVADINDGGRALPAQGAFLLAAAAVIQLSSALRGSGYTGRSVGLAALFFLSVILTGQGTATIAALAGMIIVLSLERGPALGLRLLAGSALAFVALILVIGVQSFSPDDWVGVLPGGVLENLDRRSANLGTREMVWKVAWTAYQQGQPINQIFGWPTGSTPELIVIHRAWGHVVWTHSVHSMYFGVLLNQGGVGLLAFTAALLAAAWTAGVGLARDHGAAPLALVAMIAIFSYSYGLAIEQALLLAAAAIPSSEFAVKLFQHYRCRTLPAA